MFSSTFCCECSPWLSRCLLVRSSTSRDTRQIQAMQGSHARNQSTEAFGRESVAHPQLERSTTKNGKWLFQKNSKKVVEFVFENLEIYKMISLLQTFGVSVVLPRATSVSVSERYQPPRYRWRPPRFSGISGNLPLLFWAVLGPFLGDLARQCEICWSHFGPFRCASLSFECL